VGSRRRPVAWTDAATRDLGAIRAYLSARSPQGSLGVVRRVVACTRRLGEFPEMGAVAEELFPEVRVRRVVSPPYKVYYRVEDERVLVLRVWDTRRDPSDLDVDASPGE